MSFRGERSGGGVWSRGVFWASQSFGLRRQASWRSSVAWSVYQLISTYKDLVNLLNGQPGAFCNQQRPGSWGLQLNPKKA
jgi:hypothetical protein